MKKLAVFLLLVGLSVVACGGPASNAKQPKKTLVDQYAKIYITPKIDQPGDTPQPASSAAAGGSAQMYPADTTRTMTVQYRTAGSSDAWVTLVAGKPASNGYINFKAWAQFEYRAVLSANADYPSITSPTQDYTWKSIFLDEFNPGTDWHDNWTIRGTKHGSGSTHAVGDESACSESGDGTIQVKTIKDPNTPGDWLNCHIGTQDHFTFTQGWAAARVKFQHYSGGLSGFWMQGTGGYQPGWAEVDIAERDGGGTRSNKIDNTVYWDWSGGGGANMQQDQVFTSEAQAGIGVDDWWQKYHVVSVRWTPTQYMFYVDDVKVYTTTNGISSNPEFLILSMLNRDWNLDQMTGTGRTMYVDWVQVFQ